ncbi:MAG: DNA-directed RNA polymerase subunit delta [Firmicutes bacterium]|nr:DNA-directed RNA polymerase subunit delta [Bacillota bacterium]
MQQPTDVAYIVLKEHGQAMDVHDLLDETLRRMGEDREPRKLAQIYTDINLDIRFHYQGDSTWGLRDWAPKVGTRSGVTTRGIGHYGSEDGDDLNEEG